MFHFQDAYSKLKVKLTRRNKQKKCVIDLKRPHHGTIPHRRTEIFAITGKGFQLQAIMKTNPTAEVAELLCQPLL